MKVIGEGLYAGIKRVIVHWPVEGKAETPIRIAHGFVRGEVEPNTDTVVPENIAQMLEQSGYDVVVKGDAGDEYQLADADAEDQPDEPEPLAQDQPEDQPEDQPADQPAGEPVDDDGEGPDDEPPADDPPADDPVDPVTPPKKPRVRKPRTKAT